LNTVLSNGINKNKKLITNAISGVSDIMSLDMDSQLIALPKNIAYS